MIDDFKPVRVQPDDPTRCQSVGQNGEQCPFQGMLDPTIVPGAGGMSIQDTKFLKYCRMHGSATAHTMKRQAKKLYRIARWQDRIERLGDPEVGTNLDDELASMRMVFEAALNQCETDVQLVMQAPQLQSLAREIRDTLTSNKKLKSQMGELLDRAAMHKLCDAIVVIISKHVDASKLDEVAADVAGAVAQAVSSRMEP